MSKYKNIKAQFEDFIKSQDISGLSIYEKKLINLIRCNFDQVVEVGTVAGKRAKLLTALINNNGKNITDVIEVDTCDAENRQFPIKALKSLKVKNFRGFGNEQEFNFDKKYTIIYGPNGTGKSSFCEALEYKMLGTIKEAESKRIDVEKYIVNTSTNKKEVPKLHAIVDNEMSVEIAPSPKHYQFCFIEKNRIDEFARISSKTNSTQSDSLAALFGLNDFNDFVGEFTSDFEKYIIPKPVKAEEFENRKKEVERYALNIKELQEKLKELEKEKSSLIEESKLNKDFNELELYIYGNELTKGRIAEIDEVLLNSNVKPYQSKPIKELFELVNKCINKIEEYNEVASQFEKMIDKVKVSKLYALVNDLESLFVDKCPVCETPINGTEYKTLLNPYENAREKLKELESIAEIEQKKEKLQQSIMDDCDILIADVKLINELANEFGIDLYICFTQIAEAKKKNEFKSFIHLFSEMVNEIIKARNTIEELINTVNFANEKIITTNNSLNAFIDEKKALQEIVNKIISIRTREKDYNDSIKKGNDAIEAFNKQNEQLMKEVEDEKKQIEENKRYLDAYNVFLTKLKNYKEQLPISIVKNLNEFTRDFYNAINKDDKDFDLLERVELPTKPGDIIKIYFKDAPNKAENALHVLSEGHIKCLGLSILLAKNVSNHIPVIIFDDVINAIDDDHRGGIRELLFTNENINQKQIIITSHAEEFVKDLDNHFSQKNYQSLVNRITLMRPNKQNIEYSQSSSHYLKKASEAMERSEKREVLRFCRSALESITDNLWGRISKSYNICITVQMRKPKDPPDLMSKVSGLRKSLEKDIKDTRLDNIITIYKYFEGLETNSNRVWTYLNKGVHDETDRQEFDTLIVKNVLDNMLLLENEVKNYRGK